MHADWNKTFTHTGGAEGSLMHGIGRLEPGSGAFGAALAAAERAAVTPSRRFGRSLSHVSFSPTPSRQAHGSCVCTSGLDDLNRLRRQGILSSRCTFQPSLRLFLDLLAHTRIH